MKTLTLLVITILLYPLAAAQAPVTPQQRAIVTAWNAIGESYSRENKSIDELTQSLRLDPPWRVTDAREPVKRAELIDKIIAEHRQRIKLFERIKAEESK